MKTFNLKSFLLALSAVTGFALSAVPVSAGVIGPFSGSWDGTEATQTGRINRNRIVSDGTGSKVFPGTWTATSTYLFETFQFFNNGAQDVVTIDATVSSTNTHFSAFLGTTYETLFANNAANYLGDIGSSESRPFSILAPANSAFLVVASTNDQRSSTGSFSFTVEGNSVAAVSVPVPATVALFGLGLAGLGWSKRKKT